MKKFLLVLLVLAIIVMAGWQVYSRVTGSDIEIKPSRPAVPVAVETKPIHKDSIRDIGVFTGSLEPKSQFAVAPKVAGWLKELPGIREVQFLVEGEVMESIGGHFLLEEPFTRDESLIRS